MLTQVFKEKTHAKKEANIVLIQALFLLFINNY